MGEFIKVAEKKDIPVGGAKAIDVNGKQIALFNINEKFYAIDDECTHAGGSSNATWTTPVSAGKTGQDSLA